MADSKIKIFINGEGGPLIILGASEHNADTAQSVFNLIKESAPERPFVLASFAASDWDSSFSPWPSNDGRFRGEGEKTLYEIKGLIDGELREYAGQKIFMTGYSLAGLFSLWSLYASEMFDGCACCSGSLWFEGWTDFAEKTQIRKKGLVYISLGGKEEKTKDPVMATIGDATRQQDKILEKDPNVKKKTLVMNPGGHFSSPDKRLAKGIIWLLENCDEIDH